MLVSARLSLRSIAATVLTCTTSTNPGIRSGANRLFPIQLGQSREDLERSAPGGVLAISFAAP